MCLCMLTLTLWACSTRFSHNEFRSIDAQGWNREDTLVFTLDSVPQEGDYCIEVATRLAHDFPYRSLVFIETITCDSTLLVKDTIRASLIDSTLAPRYKGVFCNPMILHERKVKLPAKSRCEVKLQHIMWREDIKGITDIGVRITPF